MLLSNKSITIEQDKLCYL